MSDLDDSRHLQSAVEHASAGSEGISIVGHGSKPQSANAAQRSFMSTEDHRGIIEYRPDELVVTVRSGTPLAELNEVIAANGQMFAFEPPLYGGRGTIGGAIASGLSGPGRPWYGSLRESLLGVEIVNGLGQRLKFGGKVIKNVAGFDVSRLFAGSWGTLGVILSASLRLWPMPKTTQTVSRNCSDVDAFQIVSEYRRKPSTLSGTCYMDGHLHLRFSGAAPSVEADVGDGSEQTGSFSWSLLRDHALDFFEESSPLWRISLNRGAFFENADELSIVTEWGGSLVWAKTESQDPPTVRNTSHQISAFRHLPTQPSSSGKYAERLKQAFDPKGVFSSSLVL